MTEKQLDPIAGKRILITGAAGGLGGLLARSWSKHYPLTLLDCKPIPYPTSFPFYQVDLADRRGLQKYLSGIDLIIHLAGLPTSDFGWESLFRANVQATVNLILAARASGCRTVVLASSVQVMDGYPWGTVITPTMPVRPANLYANSKAFMETAAARLSRRGGTRVLCLRFGWVLSRWDSQITPGSPFLDRILAEEDFVRAMEAAVQYEPASSFEIHHILSNNRIRRLNIDSARAQMGYQPRYDAYKLAWMNFPGMLRRAGRLFRRRILPGLQKNVSRAEDMHGS
jgi:uronate dehydrogenase